MATVGSVTSIRGRCQVAVVLGVGATRNRIDRPHEAGPRSIVRARTAAADPPATRPKGQRY
jgi:hypothetical protein